MRSRKKLSRPRFNLDRRSVPCMIYLSYIYKYNISGEPVRLRYSTGQKVDPDYWMGEKAKESVKYPSNRELNDFLTSLTLESIRIAKDYPLISEDDFKQKLDEFTGVERYQDYFIPSLSEYIDIFIGKKVRDEKTIAKIKTLKNKIEEYQKIKRAKIGFDELTMAWYNDFSSFLKTSGVKSINTLSKYADIVKQVCDDATNYMIGDGKNLQPLNQLKDYEKFESKRVTTSKFFFNSLELSVLAKTPTETETEETVLHYFLMMCYTGLRVSDVFELKKENFEDDVIRVFTYKGRNTKQDNEVVIPITREMRALAEYYDYDFPEPHAEQTHNEIIKELVKRSGLSKAVVKKSGDFKNAVKTVNLHSQITNHTGRYTFINIMLNEYEISPLELQKITGQSLRVLMAYERGNKTENAKKVLGKINMKKVI